MKPGSITTGENIMNKSLSFAPTIIRGGVESRIAGIGLTAAAMLCSLPALAERHEADRHWHGDIARFHEHDLDLWHRGRWANEVHDGRLGWWWVAGGSWYFYPAPVYPYPDPYEPPVTVAAAPSALPAAPVPNSWYYCEAAKGYYPYVQTCPGGWKAVPAKPAPPANPAPPPPQ
jgi:hypothetical protein